MWPCRKLGLNLAAERELLQVVESGGALYIGERFGRVIFASHRSGGWTAPLELPDNSSQVVLHDAIEIDQFAVDVINHLHIRRRLEKIDCRRARERLQIAGVRRKFP